MISLADRQRKWLDYLQKQDPETPIIACKVKNGRYSTWQPYTEFTLPVTLRRCLPNELVLDFDGENRKENRRRCL